MTANSAAVDGTGIVDIEIAADVDAEYPNDYDDAPSVEVRVKVFEDDARPNTVMLSVDADTGADGIQSTVDENGGEKTARVTATLLSGSTVGNQSATVAITVGKSTDTATEGSDYTQVNNFDITIPSRSVSGSATFQLAPINDTLDEDDETISVEGALQGATVSGKSITISDDDDEPVVSVTDAKGVNEGNDLSAKTDMTFAVRLSAASSKPVVVPYQIGGTADADADYASPETHAVTIAAGDITTNIVIPIIGDVIDEVDETVEIKLGTPTNAKVSSTQGTVTGTITDDDATTVTLARTGSGFIAEAGGTEDITVTLGRALAAGETLTVPLAVTGAVVTNHYTLALKGAHTGVALVTANPHSAQNPALVFTGTAGASAKATLALTAVDNADTAERTVSIAYGTIAASGLGGGTSAAGSPVTVAIADNDAQITIADASAAESKAVEFTVTLPSAAPDGGVTVRYATSDGRGEADDEAHQIATAAADYTAAASNASVTIAKGAKSAKISVATINDDTYEGDHHFTVTLTDASRMSISATAGKAVGTITDADDTPSFAFSAASSSVAENAGTVTVTVGKTGASLLASTVRYATADVTAVAGSDYTDTSGTLNFAAADTSKTFTVAITEDTADDDGETFDAALTAGSHAKLGATAKHRVTITDNDAAPSGIVLSVTPATIAENAGATDVTVTATVGGHHDLRRGQDGVGGHRRRLRQRHRGHRLRQCREPFDHHRRRAAERGREVQADAER